MVDSFSGKWVLFDFVVLELSSYILTFATSRGDLPCRAAAQLPSPFAALGSNLWSIPGSSARSRPLKWQVTVAPSIGTRELVGCVDSSWCINRWAMVFKVRIGGSASGGP